MTWEERVREALKGRIWESPEHILRAIRPIVEEEITKAAHTHVTSDGGTSYCPLAEDAMRRAEQAEAHADALAEDLGDLIDGYDSSEALFLYRKWKAERGD